MKIYKRVMDGVAAVEKLILAAAFVLILVLTVGNVFSRKVIHQSWSFTEELVSGVFGAESYGGGGVCADYPYGGGISLQEGRVGESFTAHRPPSGKGKETYAVSQHLSVCFIYRDIVRLRGGQSDNPVGKRETDICFKLAGMDFLVFCAHWCGMYDFAFY